MSDQRHPQVGVGVMILRSNKVLLGKRHGAHGASTYGWVGGHLEFGETLEDGARRETLEETRLVLTSLKFLCLSNIIAYDKHYVDIEFLGEIEPNAEPQIKEPDKVESWDWYDLDNLPKPLFKAVDLAISSYRSGKIYNP